MDNLEMWFDLIVNNGVAVAVIIYFCFRDWKFNNQLVELLTTIKQLVEKRSDEYEIK